MGVMARHRSYEKMVPSVKRKWLRALRSGQYRKTTKMLCRKPTKNQPDYGFCCLGVLVDLAVLDGFAVEWEDSEGLGDPRGMIARTAHTWAGGSLPDPVYAWAGLDEDVAGLLAGQNDHGKSHLQIADWIEENL